MEEKKRNPLEKVSIAISSTEKKQLQKLAEEKEISLSAMCRHVIQTYLMAINKKR